MALQQKKSVPRGMVFAFCFLVSFVFLMICSKSSFLYPFNDWSDPHCFFTVGKGMMHGQVTYRDLFEQKGPLLYFLHGLAYLVSHTTFLGVFLLEVIAGAFFLYYSYRILTLYLPARVAAWALPVLALGVFTSYSFYMGDSAEELTLPLLTASLYFLLRYFREPRPEPLSFPCVFANGVIAGCVVWIKFSLIGFWFAWMAGLFFAMLAQRRAARALQSCFVFLGGMAAATLPWVIYFGMNHAIGDWLYSYFYVNAYAYPADLNLLERLLSFLKSPAHGVLANPGFSLLLLLGTGCFLVRKQYLPTIAGKGTLLACLLFLDITVFARGVGFAYYFLIFAPFAVLGIVAGVDLLRSRLHPQPLRRINRRGCAGIAAGLAVFLAVAAYPLSPNTDMIGKPREDFAQYQFAKIINQVPDATLFCYNFLDGGFYFAADVFASEKYFCGLNLDPGRFPALLDAQYQYIINKSTDFIVFHGFGDAQTLLKERDFSWLNATHTLVAQQTQMYEGEPHCYLLFQAKP